MSKLIYLKTLYHVLKWRRNWRKYDLDYKPANLDPDKFISARQVPKLIGNDSVCISTGMAGHAKCSIFYWAIRDVFLATGEPKDLTWVSVSAIGGRGRLPGTVEELDPPGLLKAYLCGHFETAKKLTKRAEEGYIELHTFPQGEITSLIAAQALGEEEIESPIGVGTFLDPRVGTGSAVTPDAKNTYVTVSKTDPEKLTYRIPKLEVAMFNAPYADTEGNIYYQDAATITENSEVAMAVKKNNGLVFAAVSKIIEKNESQISLSKEYVDKIVVNQRNEQTLSVAQKNFWPMFTEGAKVDEKKAIQQLKCVNDILKITPKRGAVENTLARMAASLFTKVSKKGNLINFGIGLPEEVGRLLYEGGLYPDLICTAETGIYNGIPTPGIFFGGAINPEKMYSSVWIFNHYKENLDVAVLGMMQVDSTGNVNVSKRLDRVSDYVGPGGFMNIASSAKTVIFIGSWMANAKMSITDGKLNIEELGIVKFVEEVIQVTFNAQQALALGKQIFYVTNVGIFTLTKRGIELIQIAEGVDIQKDILDVSRADIFLPESGEVITASAEVMTGKGFNLQWDD